jgi:uncharacterized membrane protein YsdA (DUF1294 family)/cold shock CspA family protein
MRLKGKIIKWHADKAFGFIAPNGGGSDVFIHKSALMNRQRNVEINDVITFSITKDKNGRYCASEATFSGEKLKPKKSKGINKFSVYLAIIFLTSATLAFLFGYLPQMLATMYLSLSLLTFIAYSFDKSQAKRGAQRTPESTLHILSLLGGWPGAALAQQLIRHKSSKKEFRRMFWLTVIINLGALISLYSPAGSKYLALLA